ncbi:hypothetical protein [Trinickia soli]|uniref:hypothetical protein n=1 Tax=Trinickia soli TaxID=380675 RepID=UPI003FA36343
MSFDAKKLEALNFDGWPLPDAYLVELGRVSALWAALESVLNMSLSKLAGFEELGDFRPFVLVNHSSFPQRLDMLGALCEQLAGEFDWLKGHGPVTSALKSAQTLRNKFLHNGMHFDEAVGKAVMPVISARGKLKTTIEHVSLADIRRAAVAIDEAQTALRRLVFKADAVPMSTRIANGERGSSAV